MYITKVHVRKKGLRQDLNLRLYANRHSKQAPMQVRVALIIGSTIGSTLYQYWISICIKLLTDSITLLEVQCGQTCVIN